MVDKIRISDLPPMGGKSGQHLLPLIHYFMDSGSELLSGNRSNPFDSNPDGSVCYLLGDLDVDEVSKRFLLPLSLDFGRFRNGIWDQKSGIRIIFMDPE